jgi:hypothetical protein
VQAENRYEISQDLCEKDDSVRVEIGTAYRKIEYKERVETTQRISEKDRTVGRRARLIGDVQKKEREGRGAKKEACKARGSRSLVVSLGNAASGGLRRNLRFLRRKQLERVRVSPGKCVDAIIQRHVRAISVGKRESARAKLGSD